jgi:hypothetical protein
LKEGSIVEEVPHLPADFGNEYVQVHEVEVPNEAAQEQVPQGVEEGTQRQRSKGNGNRREGFWKV